MKTRFYVFAFVVFLLVPKISNAQFTWSFENKAPLVDNSRRDTLKLSSRMKVPELVDGISGSGIRTDGYSTCLSTKLVSPISLPVHLTGYFALETYPTDTAGFFTLYQTGNQLWVSACVDRFGAMMIGICQHDKITYYPADYKVDKFKWVNIGLDIERDGVQLLVNGLSVKPVRLTDSLSGVAVDSLVIGKDGRNKSIGIFPVTMINGIIDNIELADGPLTETAIRKLRLETWLKRKPDLSVPASRFAGDFTRPKYHLLPAANWTNETHGLIYYNGLYHIFDQKNGANLFLGQINWGHFTSPDLIHWTEHRPVLSPERGYDQNGIWSGCCFLDDNKKPAIVYSSAGEKSFDICLARPTDNTLLTWQKFKNNPIIKSSPAQYARKDFHDPYVWKGPHEWYMIVGFGLTDSSVEKGTVLLYKSTDLKNWKFIHPLFTGDPEHDDSGVFWEMPVFWKMNGKYILLVNKVPNKGRPAVALYWVGNFVNEQFIPDNKKPKTLEVINRLLSPSVAHDAAGRTTAIAIIPDETSAKATYEAGWTHLFSIPRVLNLKNGAIYQQPHPALQKLRGRKEEFKRQDINPGKNLVLSNGSHQLEIIATIIPDSCKKFGFVVGKNPDGTELTKIYFDLDKQLLVVDQTKSSLRKYTPLRIRTGNYNLAQNKVVTLHLYIDGSVIEGFINDKDAFTTRIFPEKENSNQVEIFTDGGNIQLLKAEIWQLKSSHNQTAF